MAVVFKQEDQGLIGEFTRRAAIEGWATAETDWSPREMDDMFWSDLPGVRDAKWASFDPRDRVLRDRVAIRLMWPWMCWPFPHWFWTSRTIPKAEARLERAKARLEQRMARLEATDP